MNHNDLWRNFKVRGTIIAILSGVILVLLLIGFDNYIKPKIKSKVSEISKASLPELEGEYEWSISSVNREGMHFRTEIRLVFDKTNKYKRIYMSYPELTVDVFEEEYNIYGNIFFSRLWDNQCSPWKGQYFSLKKDKLIFYDRSDKTIFKKI